MSTSDNDQDNDVDDEGGKSTAKDSSNGEAAVAQSKRAESFEVLPGQAVQIWRIEKSPPVQFILDNVYPEATRYANLLTSLGNYQTKPDTLNGLLWCFTFSRLE